MDVNREFIDQCYADSNFTGIRRFINEIDNLHEYALAKLKMLELKLSPRYRTATDSHTEMADLKIAESGVVPIHIYNTASALITAIRHDARLLGYDCPEIFCDDSGAGDIIIDFVTPGSQGRYQWTVVPCPGVKLPVLKVYEYARFENEYTPREVMTLSSIRQCVNSFRERFNIEC